MSEKLLGKYFDKAGNAIAFFDDILPKEMVDELRSFLTKYETGFGVNSYDVASAETNDNVALLAMFQVSEFIDLFLTLCCSTEQSLSVVCRLFRPLVKMSQF